MSTTPILDSLQGRHLTVVREKDYGKDHEVFDGAHTAYDASIGATHTLYCGEGPGQGTRAARLLKTRMYVAVDENEDGSVKWDKWMVKQRFRWVYDLDTKQYKNY